MSRYIVQGFNGVRWVKAMPRIFATVAAAYRALRHLRTKTRKPTRVKVWQPK